LITQKYQPKLSEMVGNSKALKELETYITEKTPVIAYGPPGVGKTSGIFAIAEKLGWRVHESNASDERKKEDLKDGLRKARMRTFRPTIFLFDEVDGMKNGGALCKIVDESSHAIVFTANELWKVPENLREKCEKVRFFRPRLGEVLGRVKEIAKLEHREVKYDGVTGDVRSSINAVMYGGERYDSVNMFDLVENIFRGRPFDLKGLDSKERRDLPIWLLDNLPRFYSGRELYEGIQLLEAYSLSGNAEVLKFFKAGKREKPTYPFFLRRMRVMQKT